MVQNSKNNGQILSAAKTIFWSGLIAGILDGVTACIVFRLKLNLSPTQVMQYIASAVYGPGAFTGGNIMVAIGTLLHFLIAFSLAAAYFWIYPHFKVLANWPKLSGLSYGLVIWLVMNLIVLPQSKIASTPFEITAVIISITWHMILVGLPIAIITKAHFDRNARHTSTLS